MRDKELREHLKKIGVIGYFDDFDARAEISRVNRIEEAINFYVEIDGNTPFPRIKDLPIKQVIQMILDHLGLDIDSQPDILLSKKEVKDD